MNAKAGMLRGKAGFFQPGPPAEIGAGAQSVLAFLKRNLRGMGGSILDLGGGRGAYADEMRRWGYDVTLGEVDPGCLAEAARQGIPTLDMRGVEWPALSDRFDSVVLIEVLEHVEDWQGFLEHAYSSARKFVLVTVPCNDDFADLFRFALTYNHIAVSDHLHHFTSPELAGYFREKGWAFKIESGDPLWPNSLLPFLSNTVGKTMAGKLALLPLRIANRLRCLPSSFPTRVFIRIEKHGQPGHG
jgi:hypothetical protein